MLPEQILNSDKMEAIINLLVNNDVKIEEEVQIEEEALPKLNFDSLGRARWSQVKGDIKRRPS